MDWSRATLLAQGDMFAVSIVVGILAGIVFGAISGTIASGKGRDPAGWFVFGLAMGFLTGLCLGWLPIVIVASLPDLKAERARQARLERENRRLRERLSQEQIKGESYRRYTTARLDVHDQELGVDTRSLDALPEEARGPQLLGADDAGFPQAPPPLEEAEVDAWPEEAPAAAPAGPQEPQWHYEAEGETVGPVPQSELVELFRHRRLGPRTLLWTETWEKWREAREVYFLQPYL